MAGGFIYPKISSDTSNLNGEDNVLIVNPGYAYQLPLEGLSDYNEIKIAWLASYTNNTDNNYNFLNSVIDENSGNSTNQDFNYIGFTYNDTVTGLPLTNGVDFIGIRFNRYKAYRATTTGQQSYTIDRGLVADDTIFQDLTAYETYYGQNGKFGYCCTSDTTELCASYYPNAENLWSDPPRWRFLGGNTVSWDDTSDYWLYNAMGIEVIDKDLPTQKLRLKLYQIFDDVGEGDSALWYNVANGELNYVPDSVDLPNVRAVVKGTDFLAEYQDLPWNKDGAALPLPNNFFWYNAFFGLRPRISTITGRKIS